MVKQTQIRIEGRRSSRRHIRPIRLLLGDRFLLRWRRLRRPRRRLCARGTLGACGRRPTNDQRLTWEDQRTTESIRPHQRRRRRVIPKRDSAQRLARSHHVRRRTARRPIALDRRIRRRCRGGRNKRRRNKNRLSNRIRLRFDLLPTCLETRFVEKLLTKHSRTQPALLLTRARLISPTAKDLQPSARKDQTSALFRFHQCLEPLQRRVLKVVRHSFSQITSSCTSAGSATCSIVAVRFASDDFGNVAEATSIRLRN